MENDMLRYYHFTVNGATTTVQALNLFDALVAFCRATNQNAISNHPTFTKLEVSVDTENNHGQDHENRQDSEFTDGN